MCCAVKRSGPERTFGVSKRAGRTPDENPFQVLVFAVHIQGSTDFVVSRSLRGLRIFPYRPAILSGSRTEQPGIREANALPAGARALNWVTGSFRRFAACRFTSGRTIEASLGACYEKTDVIFTKHESTACDILCSLADIFHTRSRCHDALCGLEQPHSHAAFHKLGDSRDQHSRCD